MPVLKDIVRIQTGLYQKPDKFGNAVYLQLKDFDSWGKLTSHLEPEIFITEKHSHHLLQRGDVLFAAKGDNNFAVVYGNEYPSAVASSSFFVLKLSEDILPHYLAWFFNHPEIQKKLKSEAKGSSISSISMKTLGNLEIKIPEKNAQNLIVKLDSLQKKEKHLKAELTVLNDQIINRKIFTRIQ